MGKSIDINLEEELGRILDEYMDDVEETANKVINQVAKEAAQKLKDTSPRDTGKYASGWTVKKGKKLNAVVYNATRPGLTHLLEESHPIRNQFGTWGRSTAQPHIAPVREWAEEEVVKRIEEALG